jgi:S-DNA-T family DNA segregation ATPase FtsK/SpoIIIE
MDVQEMARPPIFQRAPRLHPSVASGDVEIPAPPAAPSKPSISLFGILLPAAFSVVFVAATIATARGADSQFLIMSVLSGGFMAVTSIVSVQSFLAERGKYKRSLRERDQSYRAILNARGSELRVAHASERLTIEQTNPAPEECLARAERLDRRLWERRPGDPDFLNLRLGVGRVASALIPKASSGGSTAGPADHLVELSRTLTSEYEALDDVAITLPLGAAGQAGLSGPRQAVVEAARSLLVQVATHHSPSEVRIVVMYPHEESAEWRWLRWLPHVWSEDRRRRFLADGPEEAHQLMMHIYDTLNRRRIRSESLKESCAYLFVIAEQGLVESEPILPLLLTPDPSLGVYPVFLADSVRTLPPRCGAIAELGPGQPKLTLTEPMTRSTPFTPDRISADRAERFARALAPLVLEQGTGTLEIPTAVPLLDLLSLTRVDELDVFARWQASEPTRSLAVPVGRRAGGEALMVDLHERGHGPHGLAAGATGSGKSELLQSLIASLAVAFHPHELVFVLVDYKGGGMANAFLDLPHLVGTITNLEGNLAMRSLAALKSELKRREAMLSAAGVNHVDAYQRLYRAGSVPDPLPHLVMIVDEFAELKAEHPDFMHELISAVRVGRSLGVHLILATQKPAGVVDEQIWANSRFRLCLRVERPEDSQEVLKRPDASTLTSAGRAYFQVGQNEVFEMFQAAWGGADYAPDSDGPSSSDEIVEVTLNGRRRPLDGPAQSMAARAYDSEPKETFTQLQALVNRLAEAARDAGVERLPGPWLPPLPAEIQLASLRGNDGWDGHRWRPAHDWLEPVIGMVDNPVTQSQGALTLSLAKDGHVAVFGGPGTGKSTFVQTLVTSLALTYSPVDVHMYLVDFGGRALNLFAPLPHVGSVILADDAERLGRLFRFLVDEMASRKIKFGELGVNTLSAYRSGSAHQLPAIVVILDNYAAFSTAYEELEDPLVELAREAGNLGIHLVLTANSTLGIRSRVLGNISGAVALHLTESNEYFNVVGRTEGLEPSPTPGRALVKGKPPLEFQTALPIDGDTEVERTAALRSLVDELSCSWTGDRAPAIRVMPSVIPLCDVIDGACGGLPPESGPLSVPVGLELASIEPFSVDLNDGPYFLISGPVQGGKSTLLQSWLIALTNKLPPERLQLCLVDFRRDTLQPLMRLPHVVSFATSDDDFAAAVEGIEMALEGRREDLEAARAQSSGPLDESAWIAERSAIVIAIDPYDQFSELAGESKDRLAELLRRHRGLGIYVLVVGSSSSVSSSYDDLLRLVKELQTGFLLGGCDFDDLQLFNLRLPLGEAGRPLPQGQGLFARRGRFQRVKTATPQAGNTTLTSLVERITMKPLPAAAAAGDQGELE